MGQHGVDKVEQAVAGGFRTNEAAAKESPLPVKTHSALLVSFFIMPAM